MAGLENDLNCTSFVYPKVDVSPIEITAGEIAKNLLAEANQPGITPEWRAENIKAAKRFLATNPQSDNVLRRPDNAGIFPLLNGSQRAQLTEIYQAEQAAEMSSWVGAKIWAVGAAKAGAEFLSKAMQRIGVSERMTRRLEPNAERALLLVTSTGAAAVLACAFLGRGFGAPSRTPTPTHGPVLGSATLGTDTATLSPTETLAASATLRVIPTVFPPGTESPIVASTGTELPAAVYDASQYSAGDNENGVNTGGVAVLNEQQFDQYLANGYARFVADPSGFSRQDYTLAMEFSPNPVDASGRAVLSDERGPDFWKDGGLGFDANTVMYVGKDAVVGADLTTFFTASPDGISRARVVVPVADMEFAVLQGIRAAAVARHLDVSAVVALETYDASIQSVFSQKIQENGFVPNKGEQWPGPVENLSSAASFLDNDGRVCVAQRPSASDRAHQGPEQFRLVLFTDGLEQRTAQGDETRTHLDSANSAEVLISFNPAEKDFLESVRVDVVLHASPPDSMRGLSSEMLADSDQRSVRTEGDRLAPCWLVQPQRQTEATGTPSAIATPSASPTAAPRHDGPGPEQPSPTPVIPSVTPRPDASSTPVVSPSGTPVPTATHTSEPPPTASATSTPEVPPTPPATSTIPPQETPPITPPPTVTPLSVTNTPLVPR